MATEEKTFDALLNEAPMYRLSGTVTLTGALARSPEDGKFALVQADGSAITLDSSAVNSHTVIGSSFGQQIVQVELDAEKVPQGVIEQAHAGFTTPGKDNRTGPFYPEGSGSLGPNDLLTPLLAPPYMGYVPFSLATEHQVSAETLARMEAMAAPDPLARGRTDPDSDKPPSSDGTYPVVPPRYYNGHQVYHNDY